MVAIPTYIYVGDEQIAGGPIGNKAETGTPVFWGIARQLPRFNRVVPSGNDGVTGGTYSPYWDGRAGSLLTSTSASSTTITVSGATWTINQFAGKLIYIDAGIGVGQERTVVSNTADTITVSVAWATNPTSSTFHVRTGKFVPYHYMTPTALFPTLDPTSSGDNWFFGGGGITPTTMLLQELATLHGNTSPGFKFLKFGTSGGFGAGSSPMRPGQAAWTLFKQYIADMQAAVAPDTLDVRAVIVDLSTTDILNANLNYQAQAQEFITGVRDEIDSDCCVVMVNQHSDIAKTVLPAVSNFVRGVNRTLQQANEGVRLYDMQWGKFAPTTLFAPAATPTDPIYYDAETYIQAGVGLFNAIQAFYTEAPASALGNSIAGFAMFGDSQLVTAGMSPLYAILSNQESILGPDGGTVRPGVYIWNNTTEQVELYDITANASTFGSVVSGFGPESTLLKRMVDRFGAVVLFKHAEAGMPLTVESTLAGNPTSAIEEGTARWTTIETQWAKFRIAVLRDLGKQVDMRGVLVSLGENDLFSQANAEAFAAKAPVFVDSVRDLCTTRTTGDPLPFVWLQGPPPATEVDGGSTLGLASVRNTYRDAVVSLESSRGVRVLRNTGPNDYELNRADTVHYGAEAVYQIGYDAADAILAELDGEGGTATATEAPSETAAFTVEDGSGLTSSNSYCTVAFADTYHARYGNPSAWSTLGETAKEQALCIATRAADERYGQRWAGKRESSEQALDWPRMGAAYSSGELIQEDEIPVRLKQWVARAALLHVQGQTLVPDIQNEATIASETKSGAGFSKSVTYIGGKAPTTQFPSLDKMLESVGLVESGTGWGWVDA